MTNEKATVEFVDIHTCIGELIGDDEPEPGSDDTDPTKCFAKVHVGKCPVLRYSEWLVTMPDGFQVAVEIDDSGPSARWRAGEFDQWFPVDVVESEKFWSTPRS